MKTQVIRICALVLAVTLVAFSGTGAAAGGSRASGSDLSTADEVVRLQDRVAELESRLAALEVSEATVRSDDPLARVALLAERAMSRLQEMVGEAKRRLRGDDE